jgi:hypothetical protein
MPQLESDWAAALDGIHPNNMYSLADSSLHTLYTYTMSLSLDDFITFLEVENYVDIADWINKNDTRAVQYRRKREDAITMLREMHPRI